MDRIYVEEQVRDHPRTTQILSRFPDASVTVCERYGEVFNPRSQNFRLQKLRPALVLARKDGNSVLSAPPGYSIGAGENYYFSHMLNCLYDCRYCFLQGMYSSANYVFFVNFEDFEKQIHTITDSEAEAGKGACFFSGYDCDSLAMEPLTGFVEHFLPFFRENSKATLELRTKSVNTRILEETVPVPNVVVAYTLSPDVVAREFEHGAPTLSRRLEKLSRLADKGWNVGFRLDPLLPWPNFQEIYGEMISELLERVPAERIHSVTLGAMRFPKSMHDRIVKLYPNDPLFSLAEMSNLQGQVCYPEAQEAEMTDFISDLLSERISRERIFRQTV